MRLDKQGVKYMFSLNQETPQIGSGDRIPERCEGYVKLSIQSKMTKILDKVVDHIQNNSTILIKYSYANIIDVEDPCIIGDKRCSVGRFMTKEDINTLVLQHMLNLCIGDAPWDIVKSKKIKELPKKFWTNIQSLNDSETNWNEFGLTTFGEDKVDMIRSYIKKYKE